VEADAGVVRCDPQLLGDVRHGTLLEIDLLVT
jgi:hypothetical protein